MVFQYARNIKEQQDLTRVALSGGVWQNITLLKETTQKLQTAGFEVLLHQNAPPNDGGIALGQAVIGQRHLQV
jgi:hydrogenase maturation protein HypF